MENIHLHPDTIAAVKDRVDLVEVVSEYVVLQKKGREYTGLCPFHEEKTPSFSVNPSKQLYYCFGCGAGGGAIKFLMEIGKQSFREVTIDLAQRYQIPIKTLEVEQQQEIQRQISLREQLYEILAVAANFYQYNLQQEDGKIALDYVQNQRHLSSANIEQFQLGYAPNNWDALYHYLVEIKHYSVILVEQTGLIKKRTRGEGYIDYFRNRLMIPIKDVRGRVIAFGARSLDGSEPKYLNSPETELFSKSRTLFALDLAYQHIAKQDQVIVVEGYFDAIALHLAGINNVVAVLGTALTQQHIKQLSRYSESKQILLNFDADKAGLKATQRAIKEVENLVYSGQIKLKVLNIPDGKDADEFLQSADNATEQYQDLINQAPLWLDWQIKEIINSYNLANSADFELAFQSLIRLLNKISNNATKNYYLSYCAELLTNKKNKFTGVSSQELKNIYQSLQLATHNTNYNSNKPRYQVKKSLDNNQVAQSEFLLLLIYLHCPEQREELVNILEAKDLVFSLAHHRFLWQQIHQLSPEIINSNDDNYLLRTLQENMVNYPEYNSYLKEFFYLQENYQPIVSEPEHYIQSAIACLEAISLEQYKQYCKQQISELHQTGNMQKMNYFYQEIIDIETQLKRLALLRMH